MMGRKLRKALEELHAFMAQPETREMLTRMRMLKDTGDNLDLGPAISLIPGQEQPQRRRKADHGGGGVETMPPGKRPPAEGRGGFLNAEVYRGPANKSADGDSIGLHDAAHTWRDSRGGTIYEALLKAGVDVEKYITHQDGKWQVHSESGKLLGEHETKQDAVRQLAAIESHKHPKQKDDEEGDDVDERKRQDAEDERRGKYRMSEKRKPMPEKYGDPFTEEDPKYPRLPPDSGFNDGALTEGNTAATTPYEDDLHHKPATFPDSTDGGKVMWPLGPQRPGLDNAPKRTRKSTGRLDGAPLRPRGKKQARLM